MEDNERATSLETVGQVRSQENDNKGKYIRGCGEGLRIEGCVTHTEKRFSKLFM